MAFSTPSVSEATRAEIELAAARPAAIWLAAWTVATTNAWGAADAASPAKALASSTDDSPMPRRISRARRASRPRSNRPRSVPSLQPSNWAASSLVFPSR